MSVGEVYTGNKARRRCQTTTMAQPKYRTAFGSLYDVVTVVFYGDGLLPQSSEQEDI